jgi:hypothetical protein
MITLEDDPSFDIDFIYNNTNNYFFDTFYTDDDK